MEVEKHWGRCPVLTSGFCTCTFKRVYTYLHVHTLGRKQTKDNVNVAWICLPLRRWHRVFFFFPFYVPAWQPWELCSKLGCALVLHSWRADDAVPITCLHCVLDMTPVALGLDRLKVHIVLSFFQVLHFLDIKHQNWEIVLLCYRSLSIQCREALWVTLGWSRTKTCE